tara:strand:+ start:179 stop:391 length:213 start_codon:yes stop_codon:yes gene_type:complete
MTNKDEIITIDGSEYKLSELSVECQAEIQSLAFTSGLIQRLNAELAVATTASNAYKIALAEKLPKKNAKH